MTATEPATRRSTNGPSASRAGSTLRQARGYAQGKDDYLARLRKVEGQVRGLQRMIEEERWCPDVVVQVTSANRALQEVAVGLLIDHLRHCLYGAAEVDPRFDEVAATIRQMVRL